MINETNCQELACLPFIDRSFTAAILHEYEFTVIFFPVHYAEKDWVTRCKVLKNKEKLSLQIKAGVSFGVP